MKTQVGSVAVVMAAKYARYSIKNQSFLDNSILQCQLLFL